MHYGAIICICILATAMHEQAEFSASAAGRRFASAAKVPIKSTSSFHHHSLDSQPAFRGAYTLTWVRSTLSQRSGGHSLFRSPLDKQ